MKINLNLGKTKQFNKHFQFCVGSGHAPLVSRRDYFEQMKFVHDTLGIKRIRFHGIFNDDMQVVNKFSDIMPVIGADKFLEYNFSKIADAYDSVLASGLKPFVELSFMPKHLAKHLDQNILFYYGGNSGMPKEDDEWMNFIKEFIKFLNNRYGKEEVETWFFEVWNEPDLIIFFGGNMEDYFHLYEITARAIKEINPNIKVGGPSTSGSKWIKEFINFVESNNIPCDFISTHQYAGDPIGSIAGMDIESKQEEVDMNPFANQDLLKGVKGGLLDCQRAVFPDKSETTNLRNDVINISAHAVKNAIKNYPLYYTEWSENAIFGAYTNDTKKESAFLTMISLKVEDCMDGSSVWCLSDIFEEFHMYQEEFHGGFGLLTRHGIPKPSYYALRFLNDVGNERFEINDTYNDITLGAFQDEKGNVSLLVTRQNMKNLNLEKEEVNITLNFKANKASYECIDDENGNPLKEYEKMGRPSFATAKQVEEIKNKSEVKSYHLNFKKENDTISFTLRLGVNDTYFVKLEK